MIAALYVIKGGPYYGLPGVDPWDEERDARKYAGPWPVVAHPPCARWGNYWYGGPSSKVRYERGDDSGCFKAAISAVQAWDGVLEHPEGSSAWTAHNLAHPPRGGGWVPAGLFAPGWTCCVEQGHYGHVARKRTWLYVSGSNRPRELRWGASDAGAVDTPIHTTEARRARGRLRPYNAIEDRLSRRERMETPPEFRNLLLALAAEQRGPSWVPCPCCENYACTLHSQHAHDCACPPIEDWGPHSPYDPFAEAMP